MPGVDPRIDARWLRLERELSRRPDNLDAWLDVAHLVRRTRRVPAFVDPSRHLGALYALWRQVPEDRRLGDLVLAAAGLEAKAGEADPPGRYWQGRARAGEDHWYDPASGLPLVVSIQGTRLELVWVPGGVIQATDRSAWERGGVPREVSVEGAWMGRYPVRVSDYQRFRVEAGVREPSHWAEQLARPGRPVVFVDWHEASAYAQAVGGELPSEAQWQWAVLADQPRDGTPAPGTANLRPAGAAWRDPKAWDEHLRDVAAHAAGASPFGVVDGLGNTWEWSADWGAPMVDRWLGREPRDANQGRPRVCLGASWVDPAKAGKDWVYGAAAPVLRAGTRGLRVALRVPSAGSEAVLPSAR